MEWSAFRTDRSGHVGGISEVFDHQPGRYFVWGVVRCVGGVGCGVWGCSVLFLRFAVGGGRLSWWVCWCPWLRGLGWLASLLWSERVSRGLAISWFLSVGLRLSSVHSSGLLGWFLVVWLWCGSLAHRRVVPLGGRLVAYAWARRLHR